MSQNCRKLQVHRRKLTLRTRLPVELLRANFLVEEALSCSDVCVAKSVDGQIQVMKGVESEKRGQEGCVARNSNIYKRNSSAGGIRKPKHTQSDLHWCGHSDAAERWTGADGWAVPLDSSRANAVERNLYQGPNCAGKRLAGGEGRGVAGTSRQHTGMRTKTAIPMLVVDGGRHELHETTFSMRGWPQMVASSVATGSACLNSGTPIKRRNAVGRKQRELKYLVHKHALPRRSSERRPTAFIGGSAHWSDARLPHYTGCTNR